MLNEFTVLRIRTLEGKDLELIVNYSDKDELKDCQVIKMKYDNNEFQIKQSDLHQVMMTIGTPQVQKDLLPVSLTRVKKTERLLTFEFQAKNNIKKGEKVQVVAPWIDTMEYNEETFAGLVKKKKSNPFNIFTKSK